MIIAPLSWIHCCILDFVFCKRLRFLSFPLSLWSSQVVWTWCSIFKQDTLGALPSLCTLENSTAFWMCLYDAAQRSTASFFCTFCYDYHSPVCLFRTSCIFPGSVLTFDMLVVVDCFEIFIEIYFQLFHRFYKKISTDSTVLMGHLTAGRLYSPGSFVRGGVFLHIESSVSYCISVTYFIPLMHTTSVMMTV